MSAGILAAYRHGIVTSTTVMITLDLDREQLAEARDCGLGLGLHTNLTLGKPLTRGRSLVDGGGVFVRDPRRAAARAETREVRAEVEAQVERFEKLVKRPPTHLDTHHHVGLYPPVRDVVLQVARALGIRCAARTPRPHRARSAGCARPITSSASRGRMPTGRCRAR